MFGFIGERRGEGRHLTGCGGGQRGVAEQACAHVHWEVLRGGRGGLEMAEVVCCAGGRGGLEMAEVVGLEGLVVAGAKQGSLVVNKMDRYGFPGFLMTEKKKTNKKGQFYNSLTGGPANF